MIYFFLNQVEHMSFEGSHDRDTDSRVCLYVRPQGNDFAVREISVNLDSRLAGKTD